MEMGKMNLSRILWSVLLVAGAVIIWASDFGSWMAGLSDALWWQILPWVLIVLIWIYLLRMFRRRGRSESVGE